MILTDNKTIANLIGLDIIAEIADDYTWKSEKFMTKTKELMYPDAKSVATEIKDAWFDEVEDKLTSFQLYDFSNRIDFQSIADTAIEEAEERRDAEAEAKEYQDNPDNWIYDKETGVWDERY
jgi:hypothetical protein